MPTTTNYGWTTPADTDLVKDGASAIRTLGNGVDTTVKALNPETTLGDISYRSSTANTNTRLAIGTSGQVLSVSGGVPAWTTVSSGSLTLLSTTTLSSSSTTINVTDTTYETLYLRVYNVNPSNNSHLFLGINGGTTNHYGTYQFQYNGNTAANVTFNADKWNVSGQSRFMDASDTSNSFNVFIYNYTDATMKPMYSVGGFIEDGNVSYAAVQSSGFCSDTATVSSLVFTPSAGTFSGGTVQVWGVK